MASMGQCSALEICATRLPMQGDICLAGIEILLWNHVPISYQIPREDWVVNFPVCSICFSISHSLLSPSLPSSFFFPHPHARALCGDKELEKPTCWNTGREVFHIITD